MNTEIKDKYPHYHPSIFGNKQVDPTVPEPPLKIDGPVDFYPLEYEDTDQDYYSQVTDFWRILSPEDRKNLCENLASSFLRIKDRRVTDAMLKHLSKIDDQFGQLVEKRLHEKKEFQGMTRSEEFVSAVRQDLLSK
jgi:catalase